jgi:hypothetical protein
MREPEDQSRPSPYSTPEATLNSAPHRVLIVDDNVDTLETVAAIAKSLGTK